LSRSDRDSALCRDGLVNAAYQAVAFTGSVPEYNREKVVAEEQGKKISFLWMIHSSPATKSSSTRPQQVLNSSLGFSEIKGTQVDTLPEQVDTRPSFQNSQFEELGQQVDTLPEQVDTRPSFQNSQFEELGQQVDTLKRRSTRDLPPRTGRPGGIQGVVSFGCEGRPGVVSRVLFPLVVKEDLVWYPGCCSLRLYRKTWCGIQGVVPFSEMASSSTGKSTSMNLRILSEVLGHLSTRLANGQHPFMQEVPAFPSQGQVRAFSWLVNLMNAITLDMRSYIGMWNLSFMVVLAKNMKEMWWGFDALGALVEQWHPHTHTFVFQAFEASVLLEEVELFLGWRRCLEYDAVTPLLPWEEILADIVQDKMEVLRMMNKHGIFLDRLAWWLIQHAREIGGERVTRGLTHCLVGVFLFPTSGEFILYEHVGTLSLLWRGQSLAPAVLAHLYSSITRMSLGGRTCGSLFLLQVWMEAHFKFDFADKQPSPSRIFLRSSVHCSRAWYEPEDEIKFVTAHLKSRDAWRDHLAYLVMDDFIVRPLFMRTIEFKVRTREDRDLWLIRADRMVVYQPHRYHCQLGIPRGIPTSSNYTNMIVTGRNEKLMKKARKTWASMLNGLQMCCAVRTECGSIDAHIDGRQDLVDVQMVAANN
ncbi:hypothetical protein Taro_000151, partial [Colocasia esculenta]|nr:hypothetical protein [Colocasia esculenta]